MLQPSYKRKLNQMSNKVTEVTKDILPDQDIDCVVMDVHPEQLLPDTNQLKS